MNSTNKSSDTKSFAFLLASKKKIDSNKRWQIRDGVAVAGCTGPDFRYSFRTRDSGEYC